MKIYSILTPDNKVKILSTREHCHQFMIESNWGELYEDGARNMLKLTRDDVFHTLKNNFSGVFHTSSRTANYYFKWQKHQID